MPSSTVTAQVYQASVNPSRRAKAHAPSTSTLPSPPLDPISLSSHGHPSSASTHAHPTSSASVPSSTTPTPAPTPNKRGRKPNPMSRSARETQRKLNHSIIEKARRTKINEALGELKSLVPSEWGRGLPRREEDADVDVEGEEQEEEGDSDAEFNPKSSTASGKTRKKGKDGEKGKGDKEGGGGKGEKEFKLEILERTVGYLKEVIARVGELESEVAELRARSEPIIPVAGSKVSAMDSGKRRDVYEEGCGRCHGKDVNERISNMKQGEKRKRIHDEVVVEREVEQRPRKRIHPSSSSTSSPSSSSISVLSSADEREPTPAPAQTSRSGRLPSISSWLPSNNKTNSPPIDPILLTTARSSTSPRLIGSYLPSPPSSTHFNPIHVNPSIGLPPKLNLSGPIVSPVISHRTMSSSSTSTNQGTSHASGQGAAGGMTPEDEFAASSLLGLQIGMERRRRSGSLVGNYDLSGLRSTSTPSGDRERGETAVVKERKEKESARERLRLQIPSDRERELEIQRTRVQTPASLLGLVHINRS